MVGGARTRAFVAGRGGDEDAGRVGVEEGELDRVGERVGAAGDREVDDLDAVEDRLGDRGRGVGAEAALDAADLVDETQAPGAMPWIGPRSTPNTGADASELPAAV